ncbi:hypothetical protein HN371_02710 [Candidatus Poribacteria bacterium]|jgi:hypothetical protein|nr:hypothetical protein [Candidatus Poribacteria bacterium]MBT5537175.1 hypothetical protein [Candidatus Poribacteria bacterium]MBT5713582.1 hypothetical protein [Candidatus Poribacteria bacterium]MBT7098095.1 hypothetical protein [Candidatus Poribacteria bacterium]MBT7808816.1 hypothetical protein [Candidatus Poribacteria bacterium]
MNPVERLLARPTPVAGLSTLGDQLSELLGDADEGVFVFRWQVDGRVLVRLRARRAGERDMDYAWLDEDDATAVRRDPMPVGVLEDLIKRQLIEPGGEEILVYPDGAERPILSLYAMIAVGDALRCVWQIPRP